MNLGNVRLINNLRVQRFVCMKLPEPVGASVFDQIKRNRKRCNKSNGWITILYLTLSNSLTHTHSNPQYILYARRTMELICLEKWSWESPSHASDSRNKPELPLAHTYTQLLSFPPTTRNSLECVYMCYISISSVSMGAHYMYQQHWFDDKLRHD